MKTTLIAVFFSLVASLLSAATAERLLSPPTELLPADGSQNQVVAASDGRDFLLVWTDARFGVNQDVYAARVSAAGDLIDRRAVPVSATWTNDVQPSVIWNGTEYVVAFASRVAMIVTPVSAEGEVLTGRIVPDTGTAGTADETSLAWNGSVYVLTRDYNGRSTVFVLNRELSLIANYDLPSPNGLVRTDTAAVADSSEGFFLSRQVQQTLSTGTLSTLERFHLDSRGNIDRDLGAVAIESPSVALPDLAMSSTPDGVLAAWEVREGGIDAMRIDDSGGRPFAIRASDSQTVSAPVIGCHQGVCAVFWTEGNDSTGRRLMKYELAGGTTTAVETSIAPAIEPVAVASNGVRWLVGLVASPFDEDLWSAFLENDALDHERVAALGTDNQIDPQVTMNAGTTLITWAEHNRLRGRRFDTSSATAIDPLPLDLGDQRFPHSATASSADGHLAVWMNRTLNYRLVPDEGPPGPLQETTLEETSSSPAAASDGTSYMVAVSGADRVLVVEASGKSTETVLSERLGDAVRITWADGAYLLLTAFHCPVSAGCGATLVGQWLSSSGTPVGQAFRMDSIRSFDVAGSGDAALLLWTEALGSGTYARLLRRNGMSDRFMVDIPGSFRAASDGEHCLVAMDDGERLAVLPVEDGTSGEPRVIATGFDRAHRTELGFGAAAGRAAMVYSRLLVPHPSAEPDGILRLYWTPVPLERTRSVHR
ncbi:MAG: hypothetical protein WBX15_08355 [Thermoanaerobaculia bacterium]